MYKKCFITKIKLICCCYFELTPKIEKGNYNSHNFVFRLRILALLF